jgi:hypothetical protein
MADGDMPKSFQTFLADIATEFGFIFSTLKIPSGALPEGEMSF